MSFLVEDKVAVVTGGSSGIGLETVKLLLQQGAKVAWCGRDETRLQASWQKLASQFAPEDMMVHGCDVLNKESVQGFADSVMARFGQVDMLINNAGQGKVSTFAETTDQEWMDEVQLKYFSVIHPVKAFLDALKQSQHAAIVNVNSLLALKPEAHMIATSAARAALLNLTKSLAQNFAQEGIRVNSILIGMVESGQWRRRFEQRSDLSLDWDAWVAKIAAERGIPLGRLGKPEEAARALVFLASPLSSYTTGSTVDVSGGFSKHI
ncbi:SDR family oxidoreductase [Vitreoscilla massiliensis]|uniref:SDR family oxidoreductase n=1 Tax=Vitreoscilla massiliensis TaxID=1689272 RepID=A0ABY4E1T7_9NEIS|nr:SDR family oxidoreductase [Vitreoscilla massiliensis]UOO89740.1 SDR family oxidoreductase [Vitreoscilla massiliensis]